MFIANWRSMSVYMYIFAQMSCWVKCMCPCVSVQRLIVHMYVCVCVCPCRCAPSASSSSAAECCVLSLLSRCRRNSAAAAPLPHFLFSLPLRDSQLGLRSSSAITSLPLQAAGSPAAGGLNGTHAYKWGGEGLYYEIISQNL